MKVGLECFHSAAALPGEIWKARWESASQPLACTSQEVWSCAAHLPAPFEEPQKGASGTIPGLSGQGLSVAGSGAGRRQPGAGVRNDTKSAPNLAVSIFSSHTLPSTQVLILQPAVFACPVPALSTGTKPVTGATGHGSNRSILCQSHLLGLA